MQLSQHLINIRGLNTINLEKKNQATLQQVSPQLTNLYISFESFNAMKKAGHNRTQTEKLQAVIDSIVLKQFDYVSWNSTRLPKKRTLYTVLRSPHVDKKSREQFEMVKYKQLFIVQTQSEYIRSQLIRLLFQNTVGVQCQVVVHYQTHIELMIV